MIFFQADHARDRHILGGGKNKKWHRCRQMDGHNSDPAHQSAKKEYMTFI